MPVNVLVLAFIVYPAVAFGSWGAYRKTGDDVWISVACGALVFPAIIVGLAMLDFLT